MDRGLFGGRLGEMALAEIGENWLDHPLGHDEGRLWLEISLKIVK